MLQPGPNKRHRDLSSLAKGSGFFRNGVEVECYADDLKAYTLSGQPILKSSAVGTGKHSKSYKSHKLGLPKTYVTRRGKMVLFTAPEDMIMGNTCILHSKSDENYVMVTDEDPPPPPHQRHHHSLGNIHGSFDEGRNPIIISSFRPHSRVDHGNKWAGTRIREGAWQEERKVKAGHFTDVYLRSLQKSCSQVSEDCTIEDIEVLNEEDTVDQKDDPHMDLDTPLIPNCDSGLGHSLGPSSGRLSALSHQSDHTIPHGREPPSSEDEGKPSLPATIDEPGSSKMSGDDGGGGDDGELSALKKELSLYKVHSPKQQKSMKPASKNRKKKRGHGRSKHSAGEGGVSIESPAPCKPKTRKSNGNSPSNALKNESRSSISSSDTKNKPGGHLTKQGKKRRERKITIAITALEDDREVGGEEKEEDEGLLTVVVDGGGGQFMSDVSSTVSIQLEDSSGNESKISAQRDRRKSRADERSLDIERKRAEKRELERQRKLEEEERERLKEELANSQIQLLDGTESFEEEEEADNLEGGSLDPATPTPLSSSHDSIDQQQLLHSLQLAKQRESKHMLVALGGEELARKLSCDMDTARDSMAQARQIAEEIEMEERRRREEEEKRKLEEERRRQEEERTALTKRVEMISSNTARLKEEYNRELQSERRYQDSITETIMFSYFSYVPPAKKKPGKAPKKIRNRSQLQQQ